jgi:hypothetical protein
LRLKEIILMQRWNACRRHYEKAMKSFLLYRLMLEVVILNNSHESACKLKKYFLYATNLKIKRIFMKKG